METGSFPLKNPRHECFAKFVAKGMTHAEAWRASLPFGRKHSGSMNALKVSAHRVIHRPELKARVVWLRLDAQRGAEAEPEELTPAALGMLMVETTAALTAAHHFAEKVGASPRQLASIRKAMTVHAGRSQRMGEVARGDVAKTGYKLDLDVILSRLPRCKCSDE